MSPCCVSVNAFPQPGCTLAHRSRERTGFARGATASLSTVIRVAADESAILQHFAEHGWVVVDAIPASARRRLGRWVDEIAALPDSTGVLQHREATDAGPQLCRSEHFLEAHAGLRELLSTGPVVEVAGVLLGEPAVLYKEKVNYKLPGGAGYSPHQDAPAYPMIDRHVSAMIAVDDADDENGGLEVASGCFDTILPTDERGCIIPTVAESLDLATGGADGR